MNLPISWLNEFVDVSDIPVSDYCARMTDTGSKVEDWEALGSELENVRVGKILSVERHPDADRLVICSVDVGEEAPRQIVTAATNVYAGAFVPVACAPAKVVGGDIKRGKLRGAESNGMFCSIAELGLTQHDMPYAVEDGILILNDDPTLGEYKPGDDICDVLGLRDSVVEFEITPNRPDCLSMIGMARETAASYGRTATYHKSVLRAADKSDSISNYLSVEVKNSELCPRYSARVVKNVHIAPSPLWMRMRLRAAGVRPINNIVDITNYVMLEYGQPMHAFDYACLDGSAIVVRNAGEGEDFRSLDDIDHTLRSDMLVIADKNKAVALAGVMGGANSEIKDGTQTVVFESANFMGSSVRITSRALGMRTESSGRFEKGLDSQMTLAALDRACELVELLGAGEVVDGLIDVRREEKPTATVELECERINRFLGMDIPEQRMREILESLLFRIEGNTIYVPSWRDDVRCMNDIAEEVIRIWGYNDIRSTAFLAGVKTGEYTPRKAYSNRLARLLCALGCWETCTFSFISPKYYDKVGMAENDPRRRSVVIRNPLGEDTSVMRTVLLPSVLEALARNNNNHADDTALFETAPVYIPNADPTLQPAEPLHTAVAFYGGDFYVLKGMLEEILEDAGIKGCRICSCTDAPTYHPGRCARMLTADGTQLAILGELHPNVAAAYGFDREVYAAEIDTELIASLACYDRSYTPIPRYPAVSRDFAFLCNADTEAGSIEDVIARAGGELVERIDLFDVYRGEKLGVGKKSLAFSVSLRAADHTLSDEEADKTVEKILGAVECELGFRIREI